MIFLFSYPERAVFIEKALKRVCLRKAKWSLGRRKNFSRGSPTIWFVFANILIIVAIQQSNLEGHTTYHSFFIVANASSMWFFRVDSKFHPTGLKMRIWSNQYNEFWVPPKFFRAIHNLKIYYASIIRIISISESDRGDRMTPQSFFIVPNVNPSYFFWFWGGFTIGCGFMMYIRFWGGFSTSNGL